MCDVAGFYLSGCFSKADILGVVEPSTTTAGGDLKGPDNHELASSTTSDYLRLAVIAAGVNHGVISIYT